LEKKHTKKKRLFSNRFLEDIPTSAIGEVAPPQTHTVTCLDAQMNCEMI